MQLKYLFVFFVIALVLRSIWLDEKKLEETFQAGNEHDGVEEARNDGRDYIVDASIIVDGVTDENESHDDILQESQIDAELEALALALQAHPISQSYTEPAIIYEIFEGNSKYTGDDTTDNDAGNKGFEDDFPEAKYAYDDHSAEGYSNYTESYAESY